MSDETTGRFAVLEDRVERVRTDMRDHSAEDARRFDKLDTKIDALTAKVLALSTLGAGLGAFLSHFFGGH